MTLEDLGWDRFFSQAWQERDAEGLEPGRVVFAQGSLFRLRTAAGEIGAHAAGRLRHGCASPADLPAVGDWVAVRRVDDESGRIEQVLPRRSRLSRGVAGGTTQEQIAAANVDRVFLVLGLDANFSLRRLERMLTMAADGGVEPVVVLNKADRCEDVDDRRRAAGQVALGAPVLVTSLLEGRGLDAVRAEIPARRTVALIGSSGVGKSTLINRLLGGEVLRTGAVRAADGRGRHTTTHRELLSLPGGGLLIDNPGIRELRLWADEESLERAFHDVETLAAACRFRDCGHDGEPGCAVRQAVDDGSLPADRLSSFLSLRKELRYLDLRQDGAAQREQRRKWRAIHKAMRKDPRGR